MIPGAQFIPSLLNAAFNHSAHRLIVFFILLIKLRLKFLPDLFHASITIAPVPFYSLLHLYIKKSRFFPRPQAALSYNRQNGIIKIIGVIYQGARG